MAASEVSGKSESPRNVYRGVETRVHGHQVKYPIVHSIHLGRWARETKRREVGKQPAALLLEGINAHAPEEYIGHGQYGEIMQYAKETETPVAFIDVDFAIADNKKYEWEQWVQTLSLAGAGGSFALSAIADLKNGLTRRAFIKGAASIPFSSTVMLPVLNAVSDQRPGAASGAIARKLSELNDRNPLTWQRIVLLRNRVFRYKAYIVTRALLHERIRPGTKTHELPRRTSDTLELPLVVGAGHSDVARLFAENPEKTRAEILTMTEDLGMSPLFLVSCGRTFIGQYKKATDTWAVTVVADPELVQEAFKRAHLSPESLRNMNELMRGDYQLEK